MKYNCVIFHSYSDTLICVFLFVTRCFGQKLANCWGMKDSDESLWALASMRIGHDVYGVVYEEMYARGQMPIVCKGFVSNSCLRIPLYSVWASEGVSKCRRLIQTGGYALAHLSPFFENISPNKFRSDIFSNCETSQSPCCGERGLSDQWRMWPLLFLETRGNPETHKVALPPHQTRDHHKDQKFSNCIGLYCMDSIHIKDLLSAFLTLPPHKITTMRNGNSWGFQIVWLSSMPCPASIS